MEKVYTTSIFSKILYGLAAILVALGTIYTAFFAKNGFQQNHGIIILPLLGIASATLVALNIYKRKVTISNQCIKYVSVWGSREIINEDVKGFKVLDKRIVIYPISGPNRIAIRDYSSIANLGELQQDLNEKYTNLDVVGYQNNLKEIAGDAGLGN